MWDSVLRETASGEKVTVDRLGVIQGSTVDKALAVYSDRTYHQVLGIAYRDMPTPSMLPEFFNAISRRNPESKRCIHYLKGAPGAGKTFMGEMIARMRSEKGAIKVDCGQKNLAELLFEVVLDFGKDRQFYEEIDKRWRNGKLNPLSVTILRNSLGDACTAEGIDWALIGRTPPVDAATGRAGSAQADVEIALQGLKRVSELEGLQNLGGNSLGMATKEGPLIQAWKEGREIILDEFNRGKPGTTASLHTVLQFLTGEIDSVTVENTLKEKGDEAKQFFTFRREDQKAGFFVNLTGNTEEDGSDVDELPQSVSDRIIPKRIPEATEQDWQHRICQVLTGLPVSTLYRASERQWVENPAAFRNKLLEWRTMGLSEKEVERIPEIQLRLINRWQDVLQASEKLARFYYKWSQIVNADSPLYRSGNLASLMEELDERYSKEVSVGFRKILDHVKEALEMRPDVVGVEESDDFDLAPWDDAPVLEDESELQDVGEKFGDRLIHVILGNVKKTTADIGKNKLFKQVMSAAVDCGLLPASLQEARASDSRLVANLLNDNPYMSRDIDVQAKLVRDMACNFLRQSFNRAATDNDDIITVGAIRSIIGEFQGDDAEKDDRAVIFGDDPDQALLRRVRVVDAAAQAEAAGGAAPTPAPQDLATRAALLFALAAPAVRDVTMDALWTKALSQSGAISSATAAKEQGAAMAEGDAESGLAVTTLMVAGAESAATPLHIVCNRKTNALLVVGEGSLAPDLTKAFNAAGISYVDKLEKDARKQADTALNKIMGAERKKNEDILKAAFMMRVALDQPAEEDKEKLDALLVRRDTRAWLPVYITNRPE